MYRYQSKNLRSRLDNAVVSTIYFFILFFTLACCTSEKVTDFQKLKSDFITPPMSAHPGVYWYFMDGNMSKKQMTNDLESMKEAGISHVIFLEVNVGIPRGDVDFMSEKWLDLFAHAEREARRLDIAITLGVGPGWTGSGGPWVKGQSSMQHLVSNETRVKGPASIKTKLPVPKPHKPFFGEGWFTEELKSRWMEYYQDVAVVAYPTPDSDKKIEAIEKKSLVYRSPYTSDKTTPPHLPEPTKMEVPGVDKSEIVDLTENLKNDTLEWKVPEGEWTILRFVSRNNGNVTRPAPLPGVGFEADKFDSTALRDHFDHFMAKILEKIEPLNTEEEGGLKMLHMDSWEMGAQNWTQDFRQEFKKRRGYDPKPYYPVYHGVIVDNQEVSERFLWDLRMTSQELIFENHAKFIKQYAHEKGLGLSIEPYDMNPTSDLALGSIADVPMGEFWTDTFNSAFSVNEATSIAHVNGKNVVQAEAFTSGHNEKLLRDPAYLKNQGDWAFSVGINRFFYHTFVHKALGDSLKPGMTMGPYGVHWDRGQTWWPMVDDYHTYISRISHMMQQGKSVADILYLTPEGVPHVFIPPPSAVTGTDRLPDRRGYDFDACYPQKLIENASVEDGQILFPGGASYEVLVLPIIETMTLDLFKKIERLLRAGATVIGPPPARSPSLSSYPESDFQIKQKVKNIWGHIGDTLEMHSVDVGIGELISGGMLNKKEGKSLYPNYDKVASILENQGVLEDFKSSGKIRYGHRRLANSDIYFVSNTTDNFVKTEGTFRVKSGLPELWNPVNGEIYPLPEYEAHEESMTVPLQFEPHESYIIVFSDRVGNYRNRTTNFPKVVAQKEINGPWNVAFDTSLGGPKSVTFDSLMDWSKSSLDGIKYYSGIAEYEMNFELPEDFKKDSDHQVVVSLGNVKNIARITLNGTEIATAWAEPWEVDITNVVVPGTNELEIEVANLWANRLIGDEQFKDDGIKNGKWPAWIVNDEKRPSNRYTFITYPFFNEDSPLRPSGLLGPVEVRYEKL